METEIRIRAFRAVEDPETCEKFISGHRKVLEIYGISNITTNTNDWMFNPAIFVVVVETLDKEKLYGGVRLQCADGIHPLPIEEATGKMDPKIFDEVKHYSRFGLAELSGLWNSKEVAGFGIGSIFPSRVGIALANQLGIEVMISLCSPTTVRFQHWMGARIFEAIGNSGTFYYPKLDLIATALIMDDCSTMGKAHPREREKIFFLRNNPSHIAVERSPFKNHFIKINYDLEIRSANVNEFKINMPSVAVLQ